MKTKILSENCSFEIEPCLLSTGIKSVFLICYPTNENGDYFRIELRKFIPKTLPHIKDVLFKIFRFYFVIEDDDVCRFGINNFYNKLEVFHGNALKPLLKYSQLLPAKAVSLSLALRR